MGFLHSQLFVTPAYPTVSCAGETIIVTGSNTGLGKEAARHFARLGASKIILGVRNSEAGEVGSRTLVAAAVSGPESHGKYMSDAKVNDDALSNFVRSADGKRASEKVWKELREILETIAPSVTNSI